MYFTRLLSTFLLLISTTLGCSSPSDNEATTIITPSQNAINFGGGAQWFGAPSSHGGSIRSGNPFQESFAEFSSDCFSSSRTISSISISYRYSVGYWTGTPPSMRLTLQTTDGASEAWSEVVNPSFECDGEFEWYTTNGEIGSYSDEKTKRFSDLNINVAQDVNFKLNFVNNNRNVHILNGFKITVTWACDFRPFTRMYNHQIVDHLYTTDTNERPSGWVVEPPAEGRLSSTQCEGTVPLYRYWRDDAQYGQDHLYSTYKMSPEDLRYHRYTEEGTAGYCFQTQYPGTVPLYQYYNYHYGDHFYTINQFPHEEHGYTFIHIECYVKRLFDSACDGPDNVQCPDGTYLSRDSSSCKFTLCPATELVLANGQCLDIGALHNNNWQRNGANAIMFDCHGRTHKSNQKFIYDPNQKSFIIGFAESNFCLDVQMDDYSAKKNGAYVQAWECDQGQNQIFSYDSGRKALISSNGDCLDAGWDAYKAKTNGGGMQMWDCHWGENQQFTPRAGKAYPALSVSQNLLGELGTDNNVFVLQLSNQWGIFAAVFGLLLVANIVCMTYYWCNGCKRQKHKYQSVKYIDTEDEEARK